MSTIRSRGVWAVSGQVSEVHVSKGTTEIVVGEYVIDSLEVHKGVVEKIHDLEGLEPPEAVPLKSVSVVESFRCVRISALMITVLSLKIGSC